MREKHQKCLFEASLKKNYIFSALCILPLIINKEVWVMSELTNIEETILK